MRNLRWSQNTENRVVLSLAILSLLHVVGAQLAPYFRSNGIVEPAGKSVRVARQGERLVAVPTVNVPSTITFFKDGVSIPIEHEKTLVIPGVSRSDAGTYWVVANNSLGAVISDKVELLVQHVDEWSDSTIVETVNVRERDAVVLDVPPISAVPEPNSNSLTWLSSNSGNRPSDDQRVDPDASVHISQDLQLVVLGVQSWYMNWTYQAKYINFHVSSTPTYTRIFRLNVTGPERTIVDPTFAVRLPPIFYITTSEIPTFECVVNGRLRVDQVQPIPILWFYKARGDATRRNISNQANARTFGRRIDIPNLNDGDTVECEAGSENQKITSSTTISLLVRPVFAGRRMESSYAVDLGSDVSFPCNITRNPPGNLTWYQNAVEISSGDRYTIHPNGTLTLSSAQLSDSAVYQCLVQNSEGHLTDQTLLVLNSAPPTVTVSAAEQTLISGDAASIQCEVTGQPDPDVYWSFDGIITQLVTDGRRTVSRTGVHINSAVWSDSGIYTCRANNSLGIAEGTATLVVHNRTSIRTEPYNREERHGTAITRSCNLNLDDRVTATILWVDEKNSSTVIQSAGNFNLEANNQTLRVKSLRYYNDQTNFTCHVYSVAGNATKTYEIIVVGLPIAPRAIAFLSTQPRSINITWTKPFDGNRNLTHYIISYKQIDRDADFQLFDNSNGRDTRSHIASNLKPSKSYQFIVSAVNSLGQGQSSLATSAIKIPAETPSAPPTIRDLHAVSRRMVRVTFIPPPRDDWNSERILGYKIAYGNAEPIGEKDYVTSNTGEISVEIGDLTSYSPYWVKVAAYNEVSGDLKYSPERRVVTLEDEPQAPPIIRSVRTVNSTACRVVWRSPASETIKGRARGYEINTTKNGDDQQVVPKIVNASFSDDESKVLTGLSKFTYYRITIRLFTNGGHSPPATTNCTTAEDTPDAVLGLAVLEYAYNSITVGWSPPAAANGILLYYSVTVIGPGKEAGLGYNVTHPHINFTVAELTANSSYTISVKAATSIGLGPDRVVPQTTRPDPVAPGKPTSLFVRDVRNASAVISFDRVFDGEAPITEWIVQSRNNDQSEWSFLMSRPGLGSQTRELMLDPLTPHTEYYFRIIAVNIEGLGEPSDSTALVRTLMAAPKGPPVNITMRPHNSSTLIINWEPLDLSLFNGEDAGYRLVYQYKDDPSTSLNVSVTNPSSRFYILDGLSAYTEYTVQLRSVNRGFESLPSEAASARTIEDVPSEGPPNLRLSLVPASTKQIDVTWSPIPSLQSNGQILGYKIVYKPSDSSDAAKSATTTGTNVLLMGLLSNAPYHVQVLGFTRIGDGALSEAKLLTTRPDKASSPRALSLQDMQATSLTVTWLPPQYLNSPASSISYTLRYTKTDGSGGEEVISDIGSTSHRLSDLQSGAEYKFDVTAVNNEGEGPPSTVTFTTKTPQSSPELPAKPESFTVESKTARSVTLTWSRGNEYGYPIRNYTLRDRSDNEVYQESDDYIGGELDSFVVENLHPDTLYHFTLAARNDIGRSAESTERSEKTEPAKPALPPSDLSVVPKTATALNITWVIADQASWNGQLTKTRIWYTKYDDAASKDLAQFVAVDVVHPASTFMLEGLEAGNLYEIKLSSVNSKGYSDPGPPIIIYVGVAVPVGSPSIDPNSAVVGEREITITWEGVPESKTNGQLLGYKVYYRVMGVASRRRRTADMDTQYLLVGPERTSYTLNNLKIFRHYEIRVTAYNIAGEGPRSPPIIASTSQGRPGPPANLLFSELTLNMVNVTWNMPEEPNGKIVHYIIQYYSHDAQSDAEALSTSHLVTHPKTFDEIKIPRNMTFNFSIQAATKVGVGAPLSQTFTTGPRNGVPSAPSMAEYSKEDNGILIKWSSDSQGDSPIIGYVVEGLDVEWKLVLRNIDGSAEKVLLSENSVLKNVTYSRYRISLFNKKGLGEAKEANEFIPYYKTWWFRVIIALGALVIIIIITAVLCCYCFRMRAKLAEEAYEQDVIGTDNEYNTYEMRQSFKRENRRASNSKYRAEPPRPSPGAVTYSADEAPPIYDDNSSVTEKGDLTSDDDDDGMKGNASVSDSSDDDIDKAGASSVTPSYNNYQYGGYNHYVQSGAVQQSWQNSFGRGKNPQSMYAYTDSEAESSVAPSTSRYRSTNGLLNDHSNARNGSRQHLVNSSPDAPGSRAHLPNFSSFV